MSSLTHIEKQNIERELCMQGGGVLNFTNRTFGEFFREVVGVQIYDSRYDRGSGSKANRLRAFWDVATEKQLRLFFGGLLEGWSIYAETPISSSAQSLLQQILNRFGCASPNVESQQTNSSTAGISEDDAKKLASQLIEVSRLPAQQRGYEFEKFLKNMFNAYGLSGHAPFRLTGEQIDGSFVMHNETLRWTPKTGPQVKMDFRWSAGEKKADYESETQTA